ncbi:MAG: PadR family transcriptional regulator [Acidimicrobiales bacterium]
MERSVKPAVLLALAEGPSYGYEPAEALEDLLEEGRGDFVNPYQLLHSLEVKRLVASPWSDEAPGPLKRTYELTGEGAALLATWAESLRAGQERVAALLRRYEAVTEKIQQGKNDPEHDGTRRYRARAAGTAGVEGPAVAVAWTRPALGSRGRDDHASDLARGAPARPRTGARRRSRAAPEPEGRPGLTGMTAPPPAYLGFRPGCGRSPPLAH